MDIKTIKENYANRSDVWLRDLLEDIHTLRDDAIEVLKDEFAERNDVLSVEKINSFLEERALNKSSSDCAKQTITEALARGESIQKIKLDLAEKGINVYDVLNNNAELEAETIEYMTQLKDDGIRDDEIMMHVEKKFEIVEGQESELIQTLHRKGNFNIIFGILILLLCALSFWASIRFGRLPISAFAFFLIGIWRLLRGIKQRF